MLPPILDSFSFIPVSENADFIRLIIKDGTNQDVVRLVAGDNYVDLTKLSKCDYTKITEINLWGSDAAKEGQTIDAGNPASVVVTDVYMERPDAPFISTEGGFGEEITSLAYITDGTKFAIGDGGTNVLYWTTSSVDNQKVGIKSVPSDSYFYYTLENVTGLDLDVNGEEDTDNYRIKIVNASGDAFTHAWKLGSYLNYSQWGHLFAGSGKSTAEGGSHNYGGDADYYAIWKVVYSDGNGFYLKNAGINKYAKVTGTSDAVTYLKFYKSIDFTNTTMYPANDEIFALSKATGYNAETGVMTNGTWTFETPVDLSNWKYIIIAMEDGCADTSREITITDDDGESVHGNQYDGTVAGTGPEMYFSRWNHHNIGCISLDYLKNTKGMDIEKIKSLSIAGETKPFVVYLTNYDNTKLLSTNRYYCYKEGDLVRNYLKDNVGKFGTICLPYKASCAGAEVYSIASKNANGITLTKVNGLLEAGKPYFYKASDTVGKDNGDNSVDKHDVNFFRADFNNYDSAAPIKDNGLVGTFTDTTAPVGENYMVLSNNNLYTVDSDVSIAANKAWVDMSKVPAGGGEAKVFLGFGDEEPNATDINAVEIDEVLNGKFYDLQGREVANPTKGIYIVNGKKVVIK